MSSSKERLRSVSNEERMKLLSKTAWNYIDVVEYFDICANKATQVIKHTREKYGSAPFYESRVLTENVLKEFNTNRVNEIEVLSRLINYERSIN